MRRGTRGWWLVSVMTVLAVLGTACSDDDDSAAGDDEQAADETDTNQDEAGSVLDRVIDADQVVCGVNDQVPGFGFEDGQGNRVGFDIDFCKAVAAGVLGDASKVEYTPLTPEQRFVALQSGDIDVLIRNTTWTASRDGGESSDFVFTTFYDGQGMMVRADSGFTTLEDMADTTICLTAGTTTELNLATRFAQGSIAHTPQTFEENSQVQEAFIAGQCDGWTSDKSQLAGIRSSWPEDQGGPESLVILDETFSKEPLGPVVRGGDQRWADAVRWAVIATVQAEEFGVTQANVDEMRQSEDLDVVRFLGEAVAEEEGAEAAPFDPGLGLPVDFAYQIVTQVGNYGEIYERNVGPGTPLELTREGTANALWTDGGQLYAPPYR